MTDPVSFSLAAGHADGDEADAADAGPLPEEEPQDALPHQGREYHWPNPSPLPWPQSTRKSHASTWGSSQSCHLSDWSHKMHYPIKDVGTTGSCPTMP